MTDLVDYIEAAGGKKGPKAEYIIDCPFCSKKNHLSVNTEPYENRYGKLIPAGAWQCFRCGEHSLRFDRLMVEMDGISLTDARHILNRWKLGSPQWKRIQLVPTRTAAVASAEIGALASTLRRPTLK